MPIVSLAAETCAGDSTGGGAINVGMTEGPYIAEVAALIGDPARANMLTALLDGRAQTASELAYRAHVAPSTASGHLNRLVEGGLLTVVPQGRHRYYALACPGVGELLEGLAVFAANGPRRHRPAGPRDAGLAFARTCYDHLAGTLGVAIADALVARGLVTLDAGGGALTSEGASFLAASGFDISAAVSRRPLCRPCLDWSERRWHIAGVLGTVIAQRCFARRWIERERDSRSVRLTATGIEGFADWLDLRLDPPSSIKRAGGSISDIQPAMRQC